ncbi:MAG: hypothetical protein KME17_20220 [Cyanosarcina radialis HA8281-LM2]|jgi:hypothetical protein|nr:hypothetical protein [Cyanosarcina radialis HA8281-LM2]
MSTFHSAIELINNSNVVLTLDPVHSSGIDFKLWPKTLSNVPGQNHYKFKQGFNFQIKFKALYYAANNASISLNYYADALQTFSSSATTNPPGAFSGTYWSTGSNNYSPLFDIKGLAIPPNVSSAVADSAMLEELAK